jgi:hypothetical protein
MIKHTFFFIIALTLIFGVSFSGFAATWYVDGDVAISGDGTSWDEAVKTIQEAVDAADILDEIWLKQCTYYLDSTIQMNIPVEIYGGFAGTETNREQMYWQNNITTVNGQDTVRCFSVTADATVDGFSILNGLGGPSPDFAGGAIRRVNPLLLKTALL